jgi:SAM-dependent methyltransferase
MGHINDFNFVKRNMSLVKSPILDIGSKNYDNTQDFRKLFPGAEYVGVDLEDGEGVDVVLDMTSDFEKIKRKLGNRRFNTVFCFSVLEHCRDPSGLAKNASRLLNKGGIIFIIAPFSSRIHGYPSDYWRFTPEGIKELFAGFDFESYESNISTGNIGEFKEIDNCMYRAELSISKGLNLRRYGYFTAGLIYAFRKLRIMPFIFSHPYAFPPVMVNMIGKKKGKDRIKKPG